MPASKPPPVKVSVSVFEVNETVIALPFNVSVLIVWPPDGDGFGHRRTDADVRTAAGTGGQRVGHGQLG